MTALHFACQIPNFEIVKLLLTNNKIDVDIKDLEGKKPIDYTSEESIKQLLSQYDKKS